MMKAVFLVEGVNDADQIQRAFDGIVKIHTIVTEGTKVNNRVKNEINDYVEKGYTPYILSDPDDAGTALANMVQFNFPQIERIELDLKQCAYFTGKKFKAGVEHASYKYLRKTLGKYLGLEFEEEEEWICWD